VGNPRTRRGFSAFLRKQEAEFGRKNCRRASWPATTGAGGWHEKSRHPIAGYTDCAGSAVTGLFGSRCVGFFGLRCVPIARPRCAGLRGPRCVPIARPRRVDCAGPVCAGLPGLRRIIRGSFYRILRASLRTDCSASSCRIARAPLYKIVRPRCVPIARPRGVGLRGPRCTGARLHRIELAPLRRFARAATGAEWVPRTNESHAVPVRADAHTRPILRCSARAPKSHAHRAQICASECARLWPPPPPIETIPMNFCK
jgi:hypothetical protein